MLQKLVEVTQFYSGIISGMNRLELLRPVIKADCSIVMPNRFGQFEAFDANDRH
jgi:hypothetical protein